MRTGKKLIILLNLLLLLAWGFFSAIQAAPFVYIPNTGGNTVSVIDAATNTVVKAIPVGTGPRGVATSVRPQDTFTYVTNYGSSSVSIIRTYLDASSKVAFDHIRDIYVGRNPHGIAVDPAGAYAYVANASDGTVSKIDLNTYAVFPAIVVGSNPVGVVVSPDGTKVFVANNSSGTVSVISTANPANVTTIPVGTNPFGVAVNPAGTFVYVANAGDNSLSIINTADNSVTTSRDIHFSVPQGVAVNPSGTLVYVANYGSSSVSLFDTARGAVISANISVGTNPIGVSLSADGMFTYVANNGQGTVSVINNTTNTVGASITTGASPYALGLFAAPLGSARPTVTATTPAKNAVEVSMNTTVTATFSDLMDAATITAATFFLSGGIKGTVTYDSVTRTATFNPASALEKKTTYTATLTTGIRNIGGNGLATNYSWSFTTSETAKGSCFIATAVYGSGEDAHVQVLRGFRDRYLLTHPAGRAAVDAYYRFSPPAAAFIGEHDYLKAPVRLALAPVVFAAQYPLQLLLASAIGFVAVIAMRRLWRR